MVLGMNSDRPLDGGDHPGEGGYHLILWMVGDHPWNGVRQSLLWWITIDGMVCDGG